MTQLQAQTKPINKPRPVLTSVTPMVAPPEVEPMDTTTPMDNSIRAFTRMDIPKWGPWVLARLQYFWPHLNTFNYVGLLGQFMSDRGTLLLRARKALIMAVITREPLEPRPVCDIVFCFKHTPDNEQENKDVRLLFRRVEDWARTQGVRYVRVLDADKMDTDYSRTKEILGESGDQVKYLRKDLDK